mgnify:CR=1 FL=1
MSLKRQLLIVGNGDFAELWEYYVRNYFSQFNVAAFTVDAAYIQKPFLNGIPVVPFESLQKQYPPAEYEYCSSKKSARMRCDGVQYAEFCTPICV